MEPLEAVIEAAKIPIDAFGGAVIVRRTAVTVPLA